MDKYIIFCLVISGIGIAIMSGIIGSIVGEKILEGRIKKSLRSKGVYNIDNNLKIKGSLEVRK